MNLNQLKISKLSEALKNTFFVVDILATLFRRAKEENQVAPIKKGSQSPRMKGMVRKLDDSTLPATLPSCIAIRKKQYPKSDVTKHLFS